MKKSLTAYIIVVIFLLITMAIPGSSLAARPETNVHFWLTVLHNNDGESELLGSGDFGGGGVPSLHVVSSRQSA